MLSATRIIVLGADTVSAAATDPAMIGPAFDETPGLEAELGPDVELVAVTREPRRVRRVWRGAVWDVQINPYGDGGVYVEAIEVERIAEDEMITSQGLSEAVGRLTELLQFARGREA